MLKFVHLSLLLFGAAVSVAAKAESVLFLNPGSTQEAFWVSYSQFMQAAARDLGVDLQILYSQRQPELTVAQARIALQGPNRPDYLMFVNEQYVAPQILRLAQGSGVKLFMVNAVLTPDQQALVGERTDHIGSLVPNDEEGGYLMMKELIRLHPPVARDQPIEVLAFSGLKSRRRRNCANVACSALWPSIRRCDCGNWCTAAGPGSVPTNRRGNWSAAIQRCRWCGRPMMKWPSAPCARLPKPAKPTARTCCSAQSTPRPRRCGRDRQLSLLQLIDKHQAQQMLAMGAAPDYGVSFRKLSAKGRPASYRYPFGLQILMH